MRGGSAMRLAEMKAMMAGSVNGGGGISEWGDEGRAGTAHGGEANGRWGWVDGSTCSPYISRRGV